MLNFYDILTLKETCLNFNQLIEKYCLLERRELVCFHSKKTFNEAILGIGITVTPFPGYLNKNDLFPMCF